MLKFGYDGPNVFLLLVDSSKFKREIFKKMRRNILYLREGRHIEHEVAPTMACCCLYSEAPQGWGPGLFCFYGDRKFLGQDLRHSEPSANIS